MLKQARVVGLVGMLGLAAMPLTPVTGVGGPDGVWVSALLDLTGGPVTLRTKATTSCPGAESCALGYALEGDLASSVGLVWSGEAGLHVDFTLAGNSVNSWTPLPFFEPSPGLQIEQERTLEEADWGPRVKLFVLGQGEAVIDVEASPRDAVLTSHRGPGVSAAYPRDFSAAANAFAAQAGAGLLYENSVRPSMGLIGVFNMAGLSFVSDAAVHAPNGVFPCTNYTFEVESITLGRTLGVNCTDIWVLDGPAGDWRFLVQARAAFEVTTDQLWLLWADAPSL